MQHVIGVGACGVNGPPKETWTRAAGLSRLGRRSLGIGETSARVRGDRKCTVWVCGAFAADTMEYQPYYRNDQKALGQSWPRSGSASTPATQGTTEH